MLVDNTNFKQKLFLTIALSINIFILGCSNDNLQETLIKDRLWVWDTPNSCTLGENTSWIKMDLDTIKVGKGEKILLNGFNLQKNLRRQQATSTGTGKIQGISWAFNVENKNNKNIYLIKYEFSSRLSIGTRKFSHLVLEHYSVRDKRVSDYPFKHKKLYPCITN